MRRLSSCFARQTGPVFSRPAGQGASQGGAGPTELPAAVGAAASELGAAKAGGGHKRKSSESEAADLANGEAGTDRSATRQRLAA